MSKSILAKAQDGTITLTITIPHDVVKKAWENVVEQAVKNAELPGFRKGMAPKKLVEEKLDTFKIQEDVLRALLPESYSTALKEHDLKPIMSPKVRVEKVSDPKENNSPAGEWVFTATTTEMPTLTLGDYKKKIKDITAKSKIEVPGKNPSAGSGQAGQNMDEIIGILEKETKMTVPQIMLDSEVERLLSQLLDEVKSLGLSLDQYLTSTHKTIEDIKKEYLQRATKEITVEFALQKVADEEKIQVTPEEIQEALAKAKDEKEKKNLEANVYLLASILRQQKTLDFLKNL